MALDTLSKFYYGHTVTDSNFAIDFDEGAGELQASMNIGDYTLTDYATEFTRAMNAVSVTNVYTALVDRVTRQIKVTADTSAYDLLTNSGTRSSLSAWPLAGFSQVADLTGLLEYTGVSSSGLVYTPQFLLQNYIPSSVNRSFISPQVNVSSSGNEIEVVKFGNARFVTMNIKYITSTALKCGPIINDPSGLDNAISFMEYATQKSKMEFMPDRNQESSFEKVILESTSQSRSGTDFSLRELFGENLRDWYETGTIVFRKLEI